MRFPILIIILLIFPAFPASAAWEQAESSILQSARAIAASGDTLVAVGNSGDMMRSVDDGNTWSLVDGVSSVWWYDIVAESDGDLLAVGDGGTYASSSNGGSSWTSASLGVSARLYSIDRTATNGYIVGAGGTILYLSPSYNNWYTTATSVTDDLYGVQDMGDGTAWVVGAAGRFMKLSNSGLSYTNFGRIANDHLRGVHFVSSSTGWVVGENGTFKKTTDGGTSWTNVSVGGLAAQDLYDMDASGDVLIVVGEKVLIRSDDGGATWSAESFASGNVTFYGALAASENAQWAVGSDDDIRSVVYRWQGEEVAEVTQQDLVIPSESEGSPEAEPASLIKLACDDDADVNAPCRSVYYYATDGKRHAFPNEKVFYTWFDDFDNVVEVSADFMSSLPLSKNVTYHPGTRMVKFQSVSTVYAVSARGVLRAIASEAVAQTLYGANWNQQIDDIPDVFWGNYTFGEAVDEAGDYDVDEQTASVDSLNDQW